MKQALFALLFISLSVNAQTTLRAKAHFTDPSSTTPVFIDEIHVTGTRSLDSTQLNEIVGPLNQRKVGGTEEIRDRLRFRFQDYGYFLVDVKSVNVKRLDPLASLPPVDVEAEVEEGPRFRFDSVQFTGNHAISTEELLRHLPIHKGEYFSRTKAGSGLNALREAYGKLGYIDFIAVPGTKLSPSDATIKLLIDVNEGRQFRMGKLQFAGNSDLADQLRPLWKLETGAPYDTSYFTEFFKENESLLPPNFVASRSTKIARNCQDNTVTVFVELGQNHPAVPVPDDVGCEQSSEKTSQQ